MMKRITILMLFFSYVFTDKAQSTKPSLNIIFDGDSQTASGTYPAKILELLGLKDFTNIRSVNYGVSGQNTGEMVSDVTSQLVPRYNKNYNVNVVLYYIGYNDAYKGTSVDVDALYKKLLSYYTQLKKAGFKVIMINLPDGMNRDGVNAINKMYANKYGNISDVFVNCREKGGAFEDYSNSKYYRDGVHLTTTGYNYLAEKYVFPKLGTLLNVTIPDPAPDPEPSTSTDLNNGLRNYYKLDETSGDAVDAVGSNNGKVSAGISRGSSGKVNKAYYFDGNADYIKLNSPVTQKTGSYAFWINISRIKDDLLILANNAYQSRIFIGNKNNLKLETNKNGEEFSFFNNFSLSRWYHIVLIRSDNTVKFYRNGKFTGSSTISGSDNLTFSQLGYNGRSFQGALDEIGIWNRALTEAEMTKLYNNGNGLSHPFTAQNQASTKSTRDNANPDPDTLRSLETDIFIYPNPAQDKLYFQPGDMETSVQIYDLQGKLLITRQNVENWVDISDLARGIYLVKLSGNAKTSMHKLIKN